jgi:hypothetical protein
MLISQDNIRRDMLRVKDGIETKALPLLQMLLSYGQSNSEIVILEGILKASWYSPLFDLAVKEFGNNIYAYYYDLPFETTLERHQFKPNKNEFGEKEMRSWWNEKDFIQKIPERMLTKEMKLDQTIEFIYKEVLNG